VPGPAKGHISKKDPRRARWEQLQGTTAGGGYYTEGVTENLPSAVPTVVSPTGAAAGTGVGARGTASNPRSTSGLVEGIHKRILQDTSPRWRGNTPETVEKYSAAQSLASRIAATADPVSDLIEEESNKLLGFNPDVVTSGLDYVREVQPRNRIDGKPKPNADPVEQTIPLYRNQSERNAAIGGTERKKIPGLQKHYQRQKTKLQNEYNKYTSVFQVVDPEGMPSPKDKPLPGVTYEAQAKARKSWNQRLQTANSVADKYESAMNAPKAFTDKDRAKLVAAGSMESWKLYEKNYEGQLRNKIENPWKGVNESTPWHVKQKILRQLAEDELNPPGEDKAKDRSIGDYVGEVGDAVTGWAEKAGKDVAASALMFAGQYREAEETQRDANNLGSGIETPKVIPSPIRDRLRPEEEEGTLKSLFPYEKQLEYERSTKKIGYNIGALDSESPLDQALTAAGIYGAVKLGAGAVRGGSAAFKAGAAANASDEYATKIGRLLGVSGASAKATQPGRAFTRYRDFMGKPLYTRKAPDDWTLFNADDVAKSGEEVISRAEAARRARMGTIAAAGGTYIGATGGDEAIIGTLTANPIKAGEATFRGLVSMFTTPVAIAMAAASAGRNVTALESERIGGPTNMGDAMAPITELLSAYGDEAKKMFEVYTQGDIGDVREYTEEDMGYLGPAVAGVLTGAAFRGVGQAGFRATLGQADARNPFGSKEPGRNYETVNEMLARKGLLGQTAVLEARGAAEAENKMSRATQRITRLAQTLNRKVLGKNAGWMAAYNKSMNRELADEDLGLQTVDADAVSMALLPKTLGLGGKITPRQAADLLASTKDMNDSLRTMLSMVSYLPEGFYDSKVVGKMQKIYDKDVQPWLSNETVGDTAQWLDSLITLEKLDQGRVKRGEIRPDEAFKAPLHPQRYGREKLAEDRAELEQDKYEFENETKGRLDKAKTAAAVKRGEADRAQRAPGYLTQLKAEQDALVNKLNRSERDQKHLEYLEKEIKDTELLIARVRQENGGLEGFERRARNAEAEVKKMEVDMDEQRRKLNEREQDLSAQVTNEQDAAIKDKAGLGDDEFDQARVRMEKKESNRLNDRIKEQEKDLTETDVRIGELMSTTYPTNAKGARKKQLEAAKEADQAELKALRKKKQALTKDIQENEARRAQFMREQVVDQMRRQQYQANEQALIDARAAEGLQLFMDAVKYAQEDRDMVKAAYVRFQEDPKQMAEGVEKRPDVGHASEQARARETGKLAYEMKVDRRWSATLQAIRDKAEREKNNNMAAFIERNALWSRLNPVTRRTQLYFTPEEFNRLPLKTRRKLKRTHTMISEDYLKRLGEGEWQSMLTKDGQPNQRWAEDEAYLNSVDGTHGERVAFVENGVYEYMQDTVKELGPVLKKLEWFGRLQSKLTLGTSIGWLATQPFAEMLTLMASHPNPIAWLRAWEDRGKILQDTNPDSALMLRYMSGSQIGTDVVTTRMLQDHDAVGEAARNLKLSPFGEYVRKIGKLELFGEIDRAKGAVIRELGALMELDSNMKGLKRSAKATWNQMDAIEKIADILAPMTQAERLKYMYSDRGIRDAEALTQAQADALAAGEQMVFNVDRQQGNWAAITPGPQRAAASLLFFYPFTRFSLNWTFRTYPKDHPVRWSILALMGGFNANIVEDILGGKPSYFNQWAQVPMFGEDGKVVNLMPVGRMMHSANAVIEAVGNIQEPADILDPIIPFAKIGMGFFSSQDAYGNKLVDENGDELGLFDWDRVKNVGDEFLSLSPLYRELREQGLRLLGDNTKSVGDDPDLWNAAVRRNLGPVGDILYGIIPGKSPGIPVEVMRSGVFNNAMWDGYGEASDIVRKGLSDQAAKGKAKYEAWEKRLYADKNSDGYHWQPLLKDIEERYGDTGTIWFDAAYRFAKDQERFREWKRKNKNYLQYRIEQNKIDLAQQKKETTAYAIYKTAEMAGVEPPSVDSDAVAAGREAQQNKKLPPPDRVRDPISGKMIIPGGPRDNEADYGDPFHRATVPQGGRAWRRLGDVANLGWEGPDGKIRKPGDEVESLILNVFEDHPANMGPNLLNARIREYDIRKEIEYHQSVASRSIPTETIAEQKKRMALAAEGKDIFRRGVVTGNIKMERHGRQIMDAANQLEAATSGNAQRMAKAEAERAITVLQKELEQLPDWRNPKNNRIPLADRAPILAPNTIKAPRKAKIKVANRIFDLKEQLNQGGGGVKRNSAVPNNLIPKYVAAAKKYGLGPEGPAMLAAINDIETNFGELNNVTSYAGAVGWMQFMPPTWAAYGVSADGKGEPDPYDPDDAIHSAANYLKASGAPDNWYDALFAYNRADWYVKDVQKRAEEYYAPMNKRRQKAIRNELVDAMKLGKAMGIFKDTNGPRGLAYPLAKQGTMGGGPDDHAARPFGNWMSDNAVDINVPVGTSVKAVTDGVVTRLSGSAPDHDANPAGYTVYLKDAKGEEYAYMHLDGMSVKEGQKVKAGQAIGISGAANSVPHLHFAMMKGDPEIFVGKAKMGAIKDRGPFVDFSPAGPGSTSRPNLLAGDSGSQTTLTFQRPFAKALIALAKASGEPLQINEGFRTFERQQYLYDNQGTNGIGVAAAPGTSNHEGGGAADITLTPKQRELLPQFGLGLPVAGEDWHVELVAGPGAARIMTTAEAQAAGINDVSGTGTGFGGGGFGSIYDQVKAERYPNAFTSTALAESGFTSGGHVTSGYGSTPGSTTAPATTPEQLPEASQRLSDYREGNLFDGMVFSSLDDTAGGASSTQETTTDTELPLLAQIMADVSAGTPPQKRRKITEQSLGL